jgi:O-antigen/teichoic acid export membrane protein
MVGGLALAVVLALISPFLATFLDVSAGLLIAAAAGIPFGLSLPLLLGEFQGEQRFVALSLLLVGGAAIKLVGAVILGLLLGPLGIILGISLGTAAVYVGALLILPLSLSVNSSMRLWRPSVSYLAVILPSTVAVSVLLSADVLLVKHWFSMHLAGEYAAVAALGRAIFWGATAVASVLFPKIVFRESQGRSGSALIGASILLVAAGGAVGLGVLSFVSTWLLTAFAGAAYAEAARYLPWYAVGMTLFGGATVLVTTQQSRGGPAFLAVLIPLTLVEPGLLAAFHQTLSQVVQMVDLSMALLLGGLAIQLGLQMGLGRKRANVSFLPASDQTEHIAVRIKG